VRPALLNFLDSVTFGDDPSAQVKLPEGWKEGPEQDAVRDHRDDPEGRRTLRVRTRQGGDGALANVNRWRGQTRLDPIDEKDLDAATRKS